mmetsp:Transcript_8898/g.30031  ORF Transcript_8898/g.30031 Transcript_8898/m.30031 type:complete len:247 (+) Transcript_8898:1797-2537(+)
MMLYPSRPSCEPEIFRQLATSSTTMSDFPCINGVMSTRRPRPVSYVTAATVVVSPSYPRSPSRTRLSSLAELVDAGASSRVGVSPAALRRVARVGAVTRTAIGPSLSRLGNRPSARNNTNASLTLFNANAPVRCGSTTRDNFSIISSSLASTCAPSARAKTPTRAVGTRAFDPMARNAPATSRALGDTPATSAAASSARARDIINQQRVTALVARRPSPVASASRARARAATVAPKSAFSRRAPNE